MDAKQTPDSEAANTPAASQAHSHPAHWLTSHHAAVSASIGVLMLVLAIVAPLVSPPEQRGEVLVVTVLFGLAGALMLYSAIDARGAQRTITPPAATVSSSRLRHEMARARLAQSRARRQKVRLLSGLAFGMVFALAGAIAPFALSEGKANPDARFLMVLGFSPVAVSGALMVLIFGRTLLSPCTAPAATSPTVKTAVQETKSESIGTTLAKVGIVSGLLLAACAVVLPLAVSAGIAGPAVLMGAAGLLLSLAGALVVRHNRQTRLHRVSAPPGGAPRMRRVLVPRIPGGVVYRVLVPAAILLLFALIIVVIFVVIAATVTPLLR